jgi:hypothetical protein
MRRSEDFGLPNAHSSRAKQPKLTTNHFLSFLAQQFLLEMHTTKNIFPLYIEHEHKNNVVGKKSLDERLQMFEEETREANFEAHS